MEPTAAKGWFSRGYLPHADFSDLVQSVTFRLIDSVPEKVVTLWKEELGWHGGVSADDERAIELRRRVARYEDLGYGACWLQAPEIGRLVEDAMLYFDGERYRLMAWCVMPNHVHVLLETRPEHRLNRVIHSWKSFTAKEANRLLGREGAFWLREYFDRYIRSGEHLLRAIAYIEENPVKANLAKAPGHWPFSSASRR